MILTSLQVDPAELAARTGWVIKPEGACKAHLCVPLPGEQPLRADVLSERLGMPLVHDEKHGFWALGPDTVAGRALTDAALPDITLPDVDGMPFSLSSLRGQKVFLLAWASW